MKNIRVRIAPSPTGEDLHIGNVYTALINYIFAKRNKGKFIVRIEDTDRARMIAGSEERILTSLKWFGLNYDEGPDIGGPFAPYRQSERLENYRKFAEQLLGKKHAYYCFCTQQILETMRNNQQAQGIPTLYDGRCQKIGIEEAKTRIEKGEKYVIRLKVPDEGVTEFTDLIRGKIVFDNKLIDDQVLLKSDGYPTYHLGVVVDDYLMQITHVIRGEEWISSIPKHLLIYKFLDWELPVFAHGPILRNPDRSKLSKRKNPVWASWYRNEGFLPEAILNYLSLMGWAMPDEKEIFSLSELIENFKLEDVKPVGPAFDVKKLEWMNGEYIRKTQNSKLATEIYEFYGRKYPLNLIEKTIPLIRERIKKLSDYYPLCEFFFQKPEKNEVDIKDKKTLLKKMKVKLETLENWKADLIGDTLQNLAGEMGIKPGDFFMSLRIAIKGKKISPPLNESMELLGKEEVFKRLTN